ncbi:MAG: haloacid dehalogenase-like hydrolase [Prevotella sp.]|nr:haloacid dehalogenase-like hydrolase [Prevotella sp.]
MKQTRFFMLVAMMMICSVSSMTAQPNREQMAQISVDKEGNFKYWNAEALSLMQLKQFVADVTAEGSEMFVPAEDRLAVFDLDGTLLCETAPYYLHWMVMFHRILEDSTYVPTEEQLAFALDARDRVYNHKTIDKDFDDKVQDIQNSAFTGLTQQEMEAWVSDFLSTPCEGLDSLTWGTALYWPMIEVVSYLVANDFQVYFCSGSDRDIIRPLILGIVPIKRYQVIGSDCHYLPEGKAEEFGWVEPAIMERYSFEEVKGQRVVRGLFKQKCTSFNKVDFMTRQLGQKPILTFGNSSGDYPMFEYVTTGNSYPSMAFCLLCDDLVRELGNEAKADKCRKACEENGWVPVSMRDDWTTIYGPDVKRSATAVSAARTVPIRVARQEGLRELKKAE